MTQKAVIRKIFLFIIAGFLVDCSENNSEQSQTGSLKSTISFTLDQEYLIELPIDFNVALNLTVQPYTRNDTDFIMMGDIEGSRLVEIDITNKKFSRAISLERVAAGRYPVFVNHYLNEDTIIILRGISNEHSLYADTVMYSIDLNGEYNGAYELLNSPYRLSGMNQDTPQASFFHQVKPMEVSNNRFFVDPLPIFKTEKKKNANDLGVHEIGYFDFKEDNRIKYRGIPYYRNIDTTKFYAKEQLRTHLHAIDSSEILVSHANNPNLLRLSVSSGRYKSSDETGRLIPDPIALGKVSKSRPNENLKSTKFKQVIYDVDKKVAFRFASFPTNMDLKPGDLQAYRDSNIWVGAYDSDLKLIGQAIQPRWFVSHPKPIYFKGKFVCVVPTESERKFKLRFVNLDIKKISELAYDSLVRELDNIKPEITSGSINSLYQRYQIPENSIILTVSNRACPYCISHSSQYFLMNLEAMEKDGIYLVVSERSATAEVKATKSPNIIIDSDNRLEDLLKRSIDNPAIMLWDGKKVTRTMVLPPDDVKLIGSYLEFFKEEVVK
jgi:hypothetical protein